MEKNLAIQFFDAFLLSQQYWFGQDYVFPIQASYFYAEKILPGESQRTVGDTVR